MKKWGALPSFSAVIEWENVKLSELRRVRQMLRVFSTQIGEIEEDLSAPPELIILYDPDAIDPDAVRALVDEAFQDRPGIAWRLVPSQNGTYYRLKNHGAGLAKRELVMFLDSDVIPEPGWLAALIGAFRDPEVRIACGNTYIDLQGLYSRTFALFWFFPLRSMETTLAPVHYFFANNVVFRRDLFLSYQFPDLPLFRGQCQALARDLRRDGHTIFIQNAARVSHPPPNGLAHFVKRAMCEGHDMALTTKATGGAHGRPYPLGALSRFKRSLTRSARRIRHHGRNVGLGPAGAFGAFAIAATYFGLVFVGESITQVKPEIIRKRFAI
jgi:hypothetical protein